VADSLRAGEKVLAKLGDQVDLSLHRVYKTESELEFSGRRVARLPDDEHDVFQRRAFAQMGECIAQRRNLLVELAQFECVSFKYLFRHVFFFLLSFDRFLRARIVAEAQVARCSKLHSLNETKIRFPRRTRRYSTSCLAADTRSRSPQRNVVRHDFVKLRSSATARNTFDGGVERTLKGTSPWRSLGQVHGRRERRR